MRIFHFLNHTHLFNGHVNVAVDLACTQARLGHQVAVVSGGGSFDQLFAQSGVEHIVIDQTRRPLVLLRAVLALHRAIRRLQPEIIHAHMMTSAVLAYALRPLSRFKLVTTVHNEFEKSATLMGLGDRVIAVSRVVAESMQRRGIPRAKLRVILNGTSGSPRLPAVAPDPVPMAHPSVLFLGGLHPRKGVDDLITAFDQVAPQVPAAHLYLVGSGPYRELYEERAQASSAPDRIHFCGAHPDPRGYLRGADLFVLPSHSEPGALVLPEAREAACAIIATRVGGIPEMLDEGAAGLLVPPADPGSLAQALLKVLQDPGVLAQMKGEAATHLDYFTVERVSRDYLAHYDEVLSGVPARLERDPRPVPAS